MARVMSALTVPVSARVPGAIRGATRAVQHERLGSPERARGGAAEREKRSPMGNDLLTIAKEQAGQYLDPDENVVAIFQASPRGTGVSQSGAGVAVGAI